jgi:hypothetical protein
MTKKIETRKPEEQRFEFVLYINRNIVCQRYFSVKDYNSDVRYSYELKELMDNLVGMNLDKYGGLYSGMGIIPSHLKKKSIEIMYRFYNPHNIYQPKNDENKNIFEKEDIFDFEIKVDKHTIAQSTFSGNFFPQQVRYQVDIKEVITNIISEIRQTLNKKITRLSMPM